MSVQSFKLIPFTNQAKASRLGYIGKVPGTLARDSDAWFTPPEYLDAVRAVMGEIILDPFSSFEANKIVKAKHYFSINHSAFLNKWNIEEKTNVFMNPPYSAGLIGRATHCFLNEWQAGHFEEAVVLVNNATDTRWFQNFARSSDAMCITNHRISFWNIDGKKISGNTRGQVFAYFGKNKDKFQDIFEKFGLIVSAAK
jgi:phage N-6-adenine-methyltransferase